MMQHMRDQLKFNEGVELGIEQGLEQGRIFERIEMARELNIPEDVLIEQLMKKFELTWEKAKEYINKNKVE